ncbi:MAG TPA: hypothetical protein VFW75_15435, partial [Acetobacteraceae bacterium]|nr:hypothetical protein [Acetobacteraceae bacterium]
MTIARKARSLIRRMRDQFALAAADPEMFARNVSQFTHRRLYEERLLDVLVTTPLRIRIDGEQSPPALNVLQPISSVLGMTGGPNTVIHVAAEIAAQGIPVRILTDRPVPTGGFAWFGHHLKEIGAASISPSQLRIVPASDPRRPAMIGPSDIFLATHWTTAQQANDILPKMQRKFFFYLIQDYEPAFYAWSSNYALAAATYSMN